jgi:hypothetical protein
MPSSTRLDRLNAEEAARAIFAPAMPAGSREPSSYPLRATDVAKLPDMRPRGGEGIYAQSGGFSSANWWGFA